MHDEIETEQPSRLARLRRWARGVKQDVHVIYLAARDPRTPWYAKALAFVVAAYALSPIDLVPDFIPIIGYLDDLILVPLGVMLVIKLVPPEVMAEHRETARLVEGRPASRTAAVVIVVVWIAALVLIGALIWRDFVTR